LALLAACGPSLPTAELGAHPKDDYVVVEYPPPPAKVEEPPGAPDDDCVWVDGHWEYIGRRWEWRRGEWVRPPSVCRLAPARIAWEGKELRYRPPRWYPEGQALVSIESACPSPPLCGSSGKVPAR
jgi:hypothetical protein